MFFLIRVLVLLILPLFLLAKPVLASEIKPTLEWSRSTEAPNKIVTSNTLGSGVNAGLNLPLDSNQVVFDNGTFTPQENKLATPAGNQWASWPQYSVTGSSCGPKFELRHFQAKFTLPQGLTVKKVILSSPYYTNPSILNVFPINDNAYIFLNGVKIGQLGTNYGAINKGFHGTAPIANETDGWIGNGDFGQSPATNLKAGENILDIVAEERCLWGGLGFLELKLEVEDVMLDVLYFDQKNPQWGSQEYNLAKTWFPQDPTIARWGCALSSVAMILRKWGVDKLPNCTGDKCTELVGKEVNPGNLNLWLLKEPGGYKSGGRVNWEAIETLTMRTKSLYNTTVLDFKFGGNNPTELENELKQGRPAVVDLGIDIGHFVVARGIIPQKSTFAIHDPDRKYATELAQYGPTYNSLRKYIPTGTNLSTLLITVEPSVDLIVTDPLGRRTGFNPITGTQLNEIPGANYYIEPPLTDDNESGIRSGSEIRELLLETPLNGTYNVEVAGNQLQNYEIVFYGYDTEATPNLITTSGQILPGEIDNYLVSYNPNPLAPFDVTKIIQIDIKPGNDKNVIELEEDDEGDDEGGIKVVILTTPSFDASMVDVSTVRFGPGQAQEIHDMSKKNFEKQHFKDVDKDGDIDLTLHFQIKDTGLKLGDTQACLTGKMKDGLLIQGCDVIKVVLSDDENSEED